MRYLKVLYLVMGIALLAFALKGVDLGAVLQRTQQIGWGMIVVLALYFVAFAMDSYTWQMALVRVPLRVAWAYRIWKVRMVGEVFNSVIPAGGMGGEPVKAVLLKQHYGLGYREGTASLILAKTINIIALVGFLIIGFALMMKSAALPPSFKVAGGAGLIGLAVGTGLFFGVQRFRVSTLAGTWLSRWRLTRKVEGALCHIRDVDDRLVEFYTRYRGRFVGALVLAFGNWLLGAFEVYWAMMFLGNPISLTEAWIIESAAQLVRAGAFFIPAGIGAQEGTFLLVCAAITGSPILGIAVALVRRFREILWILWGILLGAMFSMRGWRGDQTLGNDESGATAD